jgi:nucleoside-diphosphate-sugar epimerase
MAQGTVLVTGISGFLGGHVALELLKAGHRVLGSARNEAKGAAARRAIGAAGGDVSRLTHVELDLLSDAGWSEAAAGCTHLIHVASPFVTVMPRDPDALLRPAVEGTRRALTAALEAGHERIVLTSSLSAIDFGHRRYDRVFTEAEWSDLDGPDVTAYAASKTLAEREAWRLVEAAGRRDSLAVINPSAIMGPLLDRDPGTSAAILLPMLKGEMPMAPDIRLEYADVRDVAAAHVAALTAPEAGGRRHIVTGRSLSLIEVAGILRAAFPDRADKLPRRALPGWFARIMLPFNKALRDAKPFLGVRRQSDGSAGRALIGRDPIPAEEAVIASARSMIEFDLL